MIAGTPEVQAEGGANMDCLEFILSVIASVVANYICKWLDGDE